MGIVILDRGRANRLAGILYNTYKDAKYYLDFKTPIDLLAAAILSAQTRDDITNSVTPVLFSRFKSARDYASLDVEELAGYISKVSFAGNKAKNIIGAAKIILDKYNGKVPDNMEDLLELPGIGRKTANTILINAYGKVEGIPVDTWVIKLSQRLGLSANSNPDKIEADLKETIERRYWGRIAYVLKRHGKELCGAVPYCSKCPVSGICPKNRVAKMR